MKQEDDGNSMTITSGVEDMVSRVKEKLSSKTIEHEGDEEERTLQYNESLPPVRRELCFKANSRSATRNACTGDGFAGKRVLKPRDYSEWEKLEKEWDKELNDESTNPVMNSSGQSVNEKGEQMLLSEPETRGLSKLSCRDLAKRAATMPDQTRRQLATKEKDKGNEKIQSQQWSKYVHSFSLPRACTKALFRSGRANYELHNLDEAERVLELLTDQDPTFTKAQNLLRTVRVEKSKRQNRKLPGGRRMIITDVGDSSDSCASGDEKSNEPDNTNTENTTEPGTAIPIPVTRTVQKAMDEPIKPEHDQTSDTASPAPSKPIQNSTNVKVKATTKESGKTKKLKVANSNRRRVVYPPSNPGQFGREGMVIEEVTDTESSGDDQTESGKEEDKNKMDTMKAQSDTISVSGSETFPQRYEKENEESALEQGDLEDAYSCYTRCIDVATQTGVSEQLAVSYRNRAIVALDMGYYQRVVDDCNEALKLQPGHPTALYRRALGRRGIGDYKGSVIDLEEAHKLLPNSANIQNELECSRKLLHTTQSENAKKSTDISNTNPTGTEFELINLSGSSSDHHIASAIDQQPVSVSPDPDWDIVEEKTVTRGSSEPEKNTENEAVIVLNNEAMRTEALDYLLIGIKLDAFMLDEIIQAMEWLCDTDSPSRIALDFTYNVMICLSQVPRFHCGLLLISDETIRAVHILIELMEQTAKFDDLARLKENYTTGF
ncbi:unnamed protein product [Echinostoma caproni]|uniref:TPR_REGION domain-containing protein n=1 Tax=Echinostoma caproni TaxID=27848 RepID=A0A183ADB8_9TREM|nr:unnamed protein product [Echinostoma caproni]